jgi:hypothetical protein
MFITQIQFNDFTFKISRRQTDKIRINFLNNLKLK